MTDEDLQPLITQCPTCHTQFRVNEKQLQIAGGKVRCGACLGVFQGVDNLVWEDGPASSESAADDLDQMFDEIEPVAAAESQAPETINPPITGPITASSVASKAPIKSEPPADDLITEQVEAEAVPIAAFESAEEPDDALEPSSSTNDDIDYEPLLGAKRVTLEDLEAELLNDNANSTGRPLLPDDLELIPSEELKAAKQRERSAARAAALVRTAEAAKVAKAAEAAKTAAAQSAATEAAAETVPPAPVAKSEAKSEANAAANAGASPAVAKPAGSTATAPPRSAPPPAPAGAQRTTTATQKVAVPVAEAAAAVANSGEPAKKFDPFARFEAKQRASKAELPAPGRGMLPGVGIAVGVVLLLGQVLLLRFDAWAQNPQIRPVYEGICAIAPCTVPPLKALNQMESLELSVRTHPEVENALMVDVLIANRAEYAQAFPAIELTFSDINSDVIAGRRFEPEDYLEGELKGEVNIPAQTPVRIQLEIEDPGEQAVSWNIEFR